MKESRDAAAAGWRTQESHLVRQKKQEQGSTDGRIQNERN